MILVHDAKTRLVVTMAAVLGVWIGLAGAVSALVGLAGRRRIRRLRQHGVETWAVAVPRPRGEGARGDSEAPAVVLEYTLPNGQVLENFAARHTDALEPGQQVLIWYDPADPLDVLVYRRRAELLDAVFVGAGILLIAVAVVFGVAGP
jgi:hypothetical protein